LSPTLPCERGEAVECAACGPRVVQLLADGSSLDDARSFGLRLAFARHLAPQARLALLERRRAQLVQRLAEAGGTTDELDVYARSVVQHTADSVAQDISWLDRLIAGERATPRSVPTELTYEGDIR